MFIEKVLSANGKYLGPILRLWEDGSVATSAQCALQLKYFLITVSSAEDTGKFPVIIWALENILSVCQKRISV